MIVEFTKESLHIDVAGSIRSKRLIQVLQQLIKQRGRPMVLRSDYAPEFVSIALLQWAADRGPAFLDEIGSKKLDISWPR